MSPQISEGNHGCSSIVEGCFAPESFGENIFDSSEFKNSADRATSDHSCTWCRWAHEHTGGSIPASAECRDGVVAGQRDFDEMFFPVGNPFLHRSNDVASLADTDTNLAPFIPHNNDRAEAHFFATLNRFGDAADLNNPLLPLGVSFLFSTVAPPPAITPSAAVTTAAASAAIGLAFSRWGNVCCAWDVLGQDLVVGFSHGSFFRIPGPLPGLLRPEPSPVHGTDYLRGRRQP